MEKWLPLEPWVPITREMSLLALSRGVRVVVLAWRVRGCAERRSLGNGALCPAWGGGGVRRGFSSTALSFWLLEGGGTGELVALCSDQEALSLGSGESAGRC